MCGLVTIAPQRLMRLTINKNERNKLLKELAMADVLAAHGYRVHLVEEDWRTVVRAILIEPIGEFDELAQLAPGMYFAYLYSHGS